jgi:hypothetical protein
MTHKIQYRLFLAFVVVVIAVPAIMAVHQFLIIR